MASKISYINARNCASMSFRCSKCVVAIQRLSQSIAVALSKLMQGHVQRTSKA
jgi:hypothetical protein